MKKSNHPGLKKRPGTVLYIALLLLFTAAAVPATVSAYTSADTVYEDIPDMPQADVDSMMVWIKSRVAITKTHYCWRSSYGRGAGVVRSVCANGLDKSGALCYPHCNSGYSGEGPVCWQNCPSGFRNDGAFCHKPESYGRGAGRIPDKKPCSDFNPAYSDDGTSCWMKDYGRGSGYVAWHEDKCKHEHPETGCEKNGAMWYPKCKAGYHHVACCICEPTGGPRITVTAFDRYKCRDDEDLNGALCYPKCRSGFHATGCCVCSHDCYPDSGPDIGISCTKKSYGRGVGEVLQCPHGYIPDETGGPVGLCYPECKAGFHGVGPVCWQSCPNGLVGCGAGCAISSKECGSTTFDQVFSVAMVAVNVATFGSTSAAAPALKAGEEAVQVGSKVVAVGGKLAKVQKALWKTVDVLSSAAAKAKDATLVKRVMKTYNGTTVQVGKQVVKVSRWEYGVAQDFKQAYSTDFATLTSQDINDDIDKHFDPVAAKYVKETWATIQMAEMAQTNGFVIAHDALSYVSMVDPTGIASVVDAYTKPICGVAVQWPTLSRSYK